MGIWSFDEHSTWRDVLRFAGFQGDRDWVYIITGRVGPTGKTFLYDQLKKNGYDAYEISEDMVGLVNYRDTKNHYFVNYAKKMMIIVLNKRIDISRFGKWNIEDRSCIHGGYTLATFGPELPWNENKFKKLYDEWIKKNPHTDINTLYPETHFVLPLSQQKLKPKIKNVIFNDPATIVFWSDGTKTVVKTQESEKFDPEKGLAMAISKKALGNNRDYYHTFLHWMKKLED